MEAKQFIRSYWNYFLELEEQLIATKHFVDFDRSNNKTFSIEYLKLLQAACSEIDVVAKMMAENFDSNFNAQKDTNIRKWGVILQKAFPDIEKISVCFNQDYTICPWKNWQYEMYLNKRNQKCYRLVKGKQLPDWWNAYNKVKHERTFQCLDTKGEINYMRANLGNLVLALGALYILENKFLVYLSDKNDRYPYKTSKMFVIETDNKNKNMG